MKSGKNTFDERNQEKILADIVEGASQQVKDPRNLEPFYNNIKDSKSLFLKTDDESLSTISFVYNAVLEKMLYNVVEEDYVEGKCLGKLSEDIGKALEEVEEEAEESSLEKYFDKHFDKLRDVVLSYKEALEKKGETKTILLDTEKYGELKIDVATGHGDIQVSSVSFPYLVNLDSNLCNPEGESVVLDGFKDEIESVKDDVDAFCFIEKIKGPVGALSLLSMTKAETNHPILIYRPRHDDEESKYQGAETELKKNDNVCIIYDLAVTGGGLLEAKESIENYFSESDVKVTDAIVLCDYDLKNSENRVRKDGNVFLSASEGNENLMKLRRIIKYSPDDFKSDYKRQFQNDLESLTKKKDEGEITDQEFSKKFKDKITEYYALTMGSEE